ncbi:head maturation protease, ClpP-related [Tissierella praeacuta]|uniref:head maturation protease, ClpP-related n=1 Tax=Tissierella praeacuta TaxID=43131 RepID=UPI003DA4B5CA
MNKKQFYNVIHNKASNSVDIDIYGAIISGGKDNKWDDTDFTLDDFKEKLDEIEKFDTINLNISSPGGSVFVASAMMSILQMHKNRGVKVNAYIMGLAASAASYLVMVADNIYMGKTAMLMIHKPLISSFFFTANATQLRKIAEELDNMEDGILMNAYMMKATKELNKDKLKDFIEKETWFSSDECQRYFNVELIEDEFEIAAKLNQDDIDILSKYRNTPQIFRGVQRQNINQTTNLQKQKIQLELDLI